jgi:Fe-S cluster assembly protein SufD
MSTWLEERRASAARQNDALGVPSSSDEHWRFTSLRGVDFATFTPATVATAGEATGAILAEGDHAGRLVMRDGGVVLDELAADVAAQGVIFGSLARLADEHAAVIEPVLGIIVGYDEKFAAENGALWTDGVLLHVPAGVKIQLPFHAAYELATPGAAQQWRMIEIGRAHV